MADPKLSDSQKELQQRMFPPDASTKAWQQRELEKLGQRKDKLREAVDRTRPLPPQRVRRHELDPGRQFPGKSQGTNEAAGAADAEDRALSYAKGGKVIKSESY